ncbi:HAD family hydrolase [Natronosalvus vescus]|uniref:HAD family hydrolase n=1 Tax=Natronosalvus vescus TaxID=2953881 RepID=UPI0020905227|nr:HAD family hydrolase [Natronosalvus vescus]
MPAAVVFDLDYTLAVPDRDRETILTDATAAADAPSLSRDAYLEAHSRHLTGESREPIFEELLEPYDTSADPEAVAAAYRQTIADSLRPLPGVESMLEELRSEYRLGLLTNGPIRAQRDKLETLGWESAFDAALVTGELEAGKPDPRAFEAILEALGVEPADAVYVGDDIDADIEGATRANMDAIQVVLEDTKPDPRATAYVEQKRIAAELPGILRSL